MNTMNDEAQYTVVLNDEEQYSLWFADREPPQGWRPVGKTGTEAECMAYVDSVWTDMRPASLRRDMAGR
jgi:MbtH protein